MLALVLCNVPTPVTFGTDSARERMDATDLDVAPLAGNRDGSRAESSRREPGHKLQQRLRADIVAGRMRGGVTAVVAG